MASSTPITMEAYAYPFPDNLVYRVKTSIQGLAQRLNCYDLHQGTNAYIFPLRELSRSDRILLRENDAVLSTYSHVFTYVGGNNHIAALVRSTDTWVYEEGEMPTEGYNVFDLQRTHYVMVIRPATLLNRHMMKPNSYIMARA